MPEANPARNPAVVRGTSVISGSPNTGQLPATQGGSHTATVYSGSAGGDATLWVGAGRLDAAFWHANGSYLALSGFPVTFYDAATPTSGGPIPPVKVCGVLGLQPNFGAAPFASGDVFAGGGPPQLIGFAFNSGLTYSSRSGQLGWSVSFTPVLSGEFSPPPP